MFRTLLVLILSICLVAYAQDAFGGDIFAERAVVNDDRIAFNEVVPMALRLFNNVPMGARHFVRNAAHAAFNLRNFGSGTMVFDVLHLAGSQGMMVDLQGVEGASVGVYRGPAGAICVRSIINGKITVGCAGGVLEDRKWHKVIVRFEKCVQVFVDGRAITLDTCPPWRPSRRVLVVCGLPFHPFHDMHHDLKVFMHHFVVYDIALTPEVIMSITQTNTFPKRGLVEAFAAHETVWATALTKRMEIRNVIIVPAPIIFVNHAKRALEDKNAEQASCGIWGDPHVTRWDGRKYDYGHDFPRGQTRNYLMARCPPKALSIWNMAEWFHWSLPVTTGMAVIIGPTSYKHYCAGNAAWFNGNRVGNGAYGGGDPFTCVKNGAESSCSSPDFAFSIRCVSPYMDLNLVFRGACANSLTEGLCGNPVKPGGCTWSAWSACSKPCRDQNGPGVQFRHLQSNADSTCAAQVQSQNCNTHACPCRYGPWTDCNTQCNRGQQTRALIVPESGFSCAKTESQVCMLKECPCNYGGWGECSEPCGGGVQKRPLLAGSGHSCPGSETQKCNTQECPACEWVDPNPPCKPPCPEGKGIRKYVPKEHEVRWCPERNVPCGQPCDENECELKKDNCDRVDGTCTNDVCKDPTCFGVPTFTCGCKPGLRFQERGLTKCIDIDECKEGTHNCHKNAICRNTHGSFDCDCKEDYEGDGVKVCKPLCDHSEWTECIGFCDGVGTRSRTTRPGLVDEQECHPLKENCDMPPCPPPEEPVCDLTAAEKRVCESVCNCAKEDPDPRSYDDCMFDCCSGRDPFVAVEYCQKVVDTCRREQALTLAENPDVEIKDCPPVPCPLNCMERGTCKEGVCACNEGWTGKGCQVQSKYFCLKASWNGFSQDISSFEITLDEVTARPELVMQRAEQVKDSVLIYVGHFMQNKFNGDLSSYLIIVNDDQRRDVDGGSYDLKITSAGAGVNAFKTDGVEFTPDFTSISAKWEVGGTKSGVVLSNLADAEMKFEFSNLKGIEQVLVGSGMGAKFDVIKVPLDGDKATLTISTRQCEDSCNRHTDCGACAGDASCGWCRETMSCLAGNAAGPTRAECKSWRYTFAEDVSRRLNIKLGWPVNYEEIDVFLAEGDKTDLPVRLSVDVGSFDETIWYIPFLIPAGKPQFAALVHEKLGAIVEDLRALPQPRIGILPYSGKKVEVAKPLASAHRLLQEFLDFTKPLAAATESKEYNHVTELLAKVASDRLDIGFVAGARRAVLFFAGEPLNPQTEFGADWETKRVDILKGNFYPIFYVTKDAIPSYKQYVEKLGFGYVMDINAHLPSAGLEFAASSVALMVATGGHINTKAIKIDTVIHGLNPGQRARYAFPLNKAAGDLEHSLLIAPGFGQATIENVKTDIPVCDSRKIVVKEDAIDEILGERAFVLELTGAPYGDWELFYTVTKLPEKGKLFQYGAGNTIGAEITEANTKITHPLHQVIYVTEEYASSLVEEVYDSISYMANDNCVDSSECKIDIVVLPVPNPPIATSFTVTTDEDIPIEFDIGKHKFDHDRVPPDGHEQPTKWGLKSNPKDMVRLLNGDIPKEGEFYEDENIQIVPPQDLNGKFEAVFVAKDDTDLESTPGTITIDITPVNDAPKIFAPDHVDGTEDKWVPISIQARDVDSEKFWFVVKFNPGWKGQLVTGGETPETSQPVTDGKEFVSEGEAEKPRELVVKFWYKGEPNGMSCDELNQPEIKCTVEQHTYASFTVQAFDDGKENSESEKKNVPIILHNVNDPPHVPEEALVLETNEDTPIETRLEGSDIDINDRVVAVIVAWPEKTDLYQVGGDKDGQLVGQDGVISNPEGKVKVSPKLDQHGDHENAWFMTTFSYQVKDGSNAVSDTREVKLHVVAVNDPSVPVTVDATAMEDTPVVISLRATDVDNPLEDLKFKIVELPKNGALFLYNPELKRQVPEDRAGVGAAVTKGQELSHQSCDNSGEVHGACVVYVPNKHFDGKDEFVWSVTDRDVFFPNKAPNTVPATLVVTVEPVNDAPIATMITPRVKENAFSVITLGYEDVENDPVVYHLVTLPAEGDLYQYSEAALTGNGEKITGDRVQVSDPQGRLVYHPPLNKNSENLPPTLFLEPSLTYYVHETTPRTQPPLVSNEFTTKIFIENVNQAPHVWNDETDKGDESLCFSSGAACVFPEDLGVKYPARPFPQPLYVGGSDIEWTPSRVIVTEIKCGGDVSFFTDSRGSAKLVLNEPISQTVVTGPTPALGAIIYFLPAQDAAGFECSVTYKLNDGKLDSPDTKTITFSLTPVNDPPRNDDDNQISIPEDEEKTFIPKAVDPEGDDFTATIVGCGQSRGTWMLNGEEIDCSKKTELPGTNNDPEKKWEITFKPNEGETGDNYNSIDIEYNDGTDTNVDTYTINVRPVNNAPLIYRGPAPNEPFTSVPAEALNFHDYGVDDGGVEVGKKLNLWEYIQIFDEDAGMAVISLHINLTHGKLMFGRLPVNPIIHPEMVDEPVAELPEGEVAPVEKTDKPKRALYYYFKGTIPELNDLLNSMTWTSDLPVEGARITIVVNDEGFTGACVPETDADADGVCRKNATMEIQVDSGYLAASLRAAAIATPAAAAAAILAAAAGVAAFKSLSAEAASAGYAPWEADNGLSDGMTSPIFESSAIEGSNQIYEGADDYAPM